MKQFVLTLIFMSTSFVVSAQKQLILVKGEKVKLRLRSGDEIVFKVKGATTKRISYINNLFDTALVAHRDVIGLHKIERLYFDQDNLMNVVGGLFILGGVGYLAIDQINLVLVQKQSASLDKEVYVPSAALVGLGLPMLLIRKKSQRIGGRYRLMVVDKGSPFYVPERNNPNVIYFPTN